MQRVLLSLILITGIGALNCRAAEKKPKPSPHEIVVYKEVGGRQLTLHIFKPKGHKSGDNRPAIVFFSGGGWKRSTQSQFALHSEYLASRGMFAACADYRTTKNYKTTPAECVKDGKSAVRWMRKHADELGINPDMLAAGGGSAGGHVAAATATVEGFNEEGEDTSISCVPNALVLFNPVYDNSESGYGHSRVKEYWREISPMHNIKAGMPPTVVFFGTKDNLVPVSTAQEFKRLMEAVGSRSDLHLYEGQKHSFFNSIKYFETLLETDKFLTSLGYLKGEPTLQRE